MKVIGCWVNGGHITGVNNSCVDFDRKLVMIKYGNDAKERRC